MFSGYNLLPFFLVALGGGVGSVLRYAAGLFITKPAYDLFPWATLSVNLIGCLLIGIVAALLPQQIGKTDLLRVLLISGVLGGFTTFSAFSLDSISLLEKGHLTMAIVYIAASVAGGILATLLGLFATRHVGFL